jgi:hypothetical protein
MPRAEEPVLDELPEYLVAERKNLDIFHKSTAEEPYNEFLVSFPLQSSYLSKVESLEAAADRQIAMSDHNKKIAWSMAPKTKFSYTALHEVVRSGDLKTLQLIAHKYPEVDLNCQTRSGRTPLHYAILMGHDEMIGFLLSCKVDASIIDKLGCNALHLAAAQNRDSLAKVLISNGLDFSQKNNSGHRPLEIMALNVPGYKNTNLYQHLIKLIIKKQTRIVELWLKDLYSCGVFEMLTSPRELTGSQLLELQEVNSGLFRKKWNDLQLVMDPNFKSMGRSTLPGQGFRDDRPSSLANGRFQELWLKYYDSLKLGCKPTVTCKFSKKTEPDTVHLKYDIRGIRKGRFDPEFIDSGLMVITLKNDLIIKEDVDPDISVEQPAIVKPASSADPQKHQKQKKMGARPAHAIWDEGSYDSDECNASEYDSIIEYLIQNMIDILEVVEEILVVVAERHADFAHAADSSVCISDVIDSIVIVIEKDSIIQSEALVFPLSFMQTSELCEDSCFSSEIYCAIDSIISKIESNSNSITQLPQTMQEVVSEETQFGRACRARFLHEGPIIDMRSLPWESHVETSSSEPFMTLKKDEQQSSKNVTHLSVMEHPMNILLKAFEASTPQNAVCHAVEVPALNLAKSPSRKEKQDPL